MRSSHGKWPPSSLAIGELRFRAMCKAQVRGIRAIACRLCSQNMICQIFTRHAATYNAIKRYGKDFRLGYQCRLVRRHDASHFYVYMYCESVISSLNVSIKQATRGNDNRVMNYGEQNVPIIQATRGTACAAIIWVRKLNSASDKCARAKTLQVLSPDVLDRDLMPSHENLGLVAIEDPRGRAYRAYATGPDGAGELQTLQLGTAFE
jgi:hypothetical protein